MKELVIESKKLKKEMNLENLNTQQQEKISEFGVNTWYVLELLKQFSENQETVSGEWQRFFKSIDIPSQGNIPVNKKTESAMPMQRCKKEVDLNNVFKRCFAR